MRFVWQLFYPIAVYELVTTSLFLALPGGQPILLQSASAALTLLILIPVYRRRKSEWERYLPRVPSDVKRGSAGLGERRLPSDVKRGSAGLGEKQVRQAGSAVSVGKQNAAAGKTGALRTGAVLAAAGAAASLFANDLLRISGLMERFPGYQVTNEMIYSVPLWQQLLLSGLLVPAAEEVVFRGLGYETLRRRFDWLAAALISSAVFGIYHGSVVQGIYAFLIGILLAYACETCGICGSAAAHMAGNLTVILLEAAGFEKAAGRPWRILVTAGAGIVLAACLAGLRRMKHGGNHTGEEH